METRRLGKMGLNVSALCLGSMQFGWTADEETSYQILSNAWEVGINFIDTVDVYSRWAPGNSACTAERIIGPRSLEQLEDNLGARQVELAQEQWDSLDKASAWK